MELKTKYSHEDAMQKEQPNAILLDGIELPSYQCMWEHRKKLDCRMDRILRFSVLQGIAIITLAIVLLVK